MMKAMKPDMMDDAIMMIINDRHGNDGIGNGYGRNGFGAPKAVNMAEEKKGRSNCGKINCMCSSCFACGRGVFVFVLKFPL